MLEAFAQAVNVSKVPVIQTAALNKQTLQLGKSADKHGGVFQDMEVLSMQPMATSIGHAMAAEPAIQVRVWSILGIDILPFCSFECCSQCFVQAMSWGEQRKQCLCMYKEDSYCMSSRLNFASSRIVGRAAFISCRRFTASSLRTAVYMTIVQFF